MIINKSELRSSGSNPEWVREKKVLECVQISRSRLFEGRDEGWVKFAELRKEGKRKGIVLYHLPSLTAFLERLATKQARGRKPNLHWKGDGE